MTQHFSDTLPSEQLSKRSVCYEDIDQGGLVKRQRVLNQTTIDELLIHRRINISQHGAGEQFAYDLGRSGSSIQSPNLDPLPFAGESHKSGDRLAARIMVLHAPLGAVRRKAGEYAEECLFSYTAVSLPMPSGRRLHGLIRALDVLVEFYGTGILRDPRDFVAG